jgi:hypothetical protein
MANLIKNSFRGGLVDKTLSARIDLEKNNQSCQELKNFILQPQGGVYRRPALKFISEPALDGTSTPVDDQPTLIPLVYNIESSYIVALLDLKYKIYRNDSYIDEGDNNFTEDQNKTVDYAQSADTLYLVHKEAAPFKIIRTSAISFVENSLQFGASLPTPTGFTGSFLGGAGTTDIQYAITAVTDDGKESLPAFYTITIGKSILEWQTKNYALLTWTDPAPAFPPIDMRALVIYETTPRLVTVGLNQYGYYSADSLAWTQSNTLNIPSNQVYALGVNPNVPRYVAGGVSNQGSYSADGITWTALTFTFGTAPCRDIAASTTSNWWVAVGASATTINKASRSADGITWNAVADPKIPGASPKCVGVNETGPRFVILGTLGRSSYSDDNGLTWTAGGSTGFPGDGARDVLYSTSLSRWVGVGAGAWTTYSDNNGATWTPVLNYSIFGVSDINGVAINESAPILVAVGEDGKMAYSDDGISWEKIDITPFGSSDIYSVVYSTSLGLFVAVGDDGKVGTSEDGVFWEELTVPDAHNIYKLNQGVYGYIGTARGTNQFLDYNYEPVITDSIPEAYNPFEGENPGVIALFQQRLWFANTLSKSQTIFASRIADFENFNYAAFIRPDDSIENTIYSGKPDGIQWMAPFNKSMKVGTIEKAWNLSIAPPRQVGAWNDINIEPEVDWGASKVKPVLTGNSLVYVENKGAKLFDVFERQEYRGITGDNLSVNSADLFEGFEIVSMAYQRTPDPIVWCVRDDGKVVALTYLKNENLWGWHLHETDGDFKNVVVIPGAVYDEVYFTVFRNSKYLLEKLETKWTGDLKDSRFLDSYVYKEEVTPFTVFPGLDHLEGKTVSVVTDGEPSATTYVVAGGSITLSAPVLNAYVGLPYTSVLSPLNSEFASQNKVISLGKTKTIGDITLRVKESKGGKAGARLDYLDKLKTYDYETTSGETYDGDVKVPFTNKFSRDNNIFIVQDEIYPMTITALFIELTMGDR